MKNLTVLQQLLTISILSITLNACSNYHTPTPQKLSQDILSLPPSTIFSVISQDSYPIPKNAEIFEHNGIYKTIDNIYDEKGHKILIPRGAIVSGTYTNDGKTCEINWKSIYINMWEYNHNRGSLSLTTQTQPSICDPLKGVQKNDRVIIATNKLFEPPLM